MFGGVWEVQTHKITTMNISSKNLFTKIDLYILHKFRVKVNVSYILHGAAIPVAPNMN